MDQYEWLDAPGRDDGGICVSRSCLRIVSLFGENVRVNVYYTRSTIAPIEYRVGARSCSRVVSLTGDRARIHVFFKRTEQRFHVVSPRSRKAMRQSAVSFS